MFLKVSPWRGLRCLVKRWKLNPRYIGPLSVFEKIGKEAYWLELPSKLTGIYNVLHVYYLRKWVGYKVEFCVFRVDSCYRTNSWLKNPQRLWIERLKKIRRKMINLVLFKYKHLKKNQLSFRRQRRNEKEIFVPFLGFYDPDNKIR